MRAAVVTLHRYTGLVLAGFLLLAGVTGSLLAWNEELDAALNPTLFHAVPPAPGAQPLDAAELREIVAARHPAARVNFVPFARTPHGATYFLIDPATPDGDDQVFVHPWTGDILGSRRWGDIGQGTKNLMPFIYRLHYSLALDAVGTTLLGIVALLWTIDCLASAWLTLPPMRRGAGKSWLARWWPAWKVRRGGGTYKLNVDLHRAGGLWPWAMLFVIAWSSVAFNLGAVYHPVMRAFFAHQPAEELLPRRDAPQPLPGMSWQAARETGRRLMAEACRERGERVLEETMMRYDPRTATFRYIVRSTADVRDRYGATAVVFDAGTGLPYSYWWPTGAASGDTIRTWITSLHLAALWGVPFKLFMTMLGLAVAMLSVTGVVIWRRKRQGRIAAAQRNKRSEAVLT
ncbi:PepSY-associated TM helix domain-containing protein [Massilia sp. METH4]|uniref:PepSY-associated TM helix domain-containing protein n=1 Tax=Massilia sp. METH4 TaxID=3123041 RepID=UPI0030D1C0ED